MPGQTPAEITNQTNAELYSLHGADSVEITNAGHLAEVNGAIFDSFATYNPLKALQILVRAGEAKSAQMSPDEAYIKGAESILGLLAAVETTTNLQLPSKNTSGIPQEQSRDLLDADLLGDTLSGYGNEISDQSAISFAAHLKDNHPVLYASLWEKYEMTNTDSKITNYNHELAFIRTLNAIRIGIEATRNAFKSLGDSDGMAS